MFKPALFNKTLNSAELRA